MSIYLAGSRIELAESTLRVELPDGAKVGQKFTLTGEATITAIEAELIDVGDRKWLPGETTTRMLVTNAELTPADDA